MECTIVSCEVRSIWEVVSLVDNPHLPPHARIRDVGKQEEHLTSVSALLDQSFYKPTEIKPVVTPEPQNSNDRITDLFGEQGQQAQG